MTSKTTDVEIAPLELEVTVDRPPEEAFRVFTEQMADWWPLATHSVGQERAVTVTFELRVGGRIFERQEDGSEAEWGRVLALESPDLVRFSWHPGREPKSAQEVEVRFQPAGSGRTRVELIHRGWETYGEGAEAMREQYRTGWGYVLGERYAGAVQPAA